MYTIPNIQIQHIGPPKKPLQVIRGFVALPCWTGFFLIEEPDYVIKTKVVTDGRIDLWVRGEIGTDHSFTTSQEQLNAYAFLVEQQERIKQAIIKELREAFPRLLAEEYTSWDQENGDFPNPADLTPGFDFKDYIGPVSISIEKAVKDEVAYITWNFRCRWDPEHGFEVITHKDRVIDIGPEADVFKIEQDNGTYRESDKLKYRELVVPEKKKWWQFW